jgi:predicted dehydrogenase
MWEINGTAGDLRITGPSGLAQMTELTLAGAGNGEKQLQILTVPESYRWVPPELKGPAVNVAQVYSQFASDLREGTLLSADFDHAVRRHRMIAAIEGSAASGERVRL